MKRTSAFVLLGLVVISSACAERGGSTMQNAQTTPNETHLSWDSPRLRGVQKEWDALSDSFGDDTWTKSNWGDRNKKLEGILSRRLSKKDLRELAASSDKLPIREEDRSAFTIAVYDYMVFAFVDSGDRENLVKLLSTRFRKCLYLHRHIECCLVVHGEKTLTHPILILGDAYAQCKVPEVRRDIAAAIRRGFDTMRIPDLETGKLSDDEYVKNAMQWYNAHKEDLVPNLEYIHNAVMGWPNYALFTSKSETAKKK